MGMSAFSLYSRSADLSRTGMVWYAFLGISAALVTLAAAVATEVHRSALPLPIWCSAMLSVLHSIATSQAPQPTFAILAVPLLRIRITMLLYLSLRPYNHLGSI